MSLCRQLTLRHTYKEVGDELEEAGWILEDK